VKLNFISKQKFDCNIFDVNQSCNAQILEVQPKPKASHFGIKNYWMYYNTRLINGEEKKKL
jgi:hypothetical protein